MRISDWSSDVCSSDLRIIQLKIEREAVNKDTDEASQRRLKAIEDELLKMQREYNDYEEIWKAEKAGMQGSQAIKEEIECTRAEMAELQRKGQLDKLAQPGGKEAGRERERE